MVKDVSCYYNRGVRTDVAFVFSVPGKKEKEDKRPVSGKTGENLEELLKKLDLGEFNGRYDFRITNSYDKPIYRTMDSSRTEPTKSEIKEERNIDRLAEELSDIEEYIIFFGEKAKYASSLLTRSNFKAKFIYSRHLGLQSLNQIKTDINGDHITRGESWNTMKRLSVIAKQVKDDMSK